MILPRLETPTEPVSRHASPRGERQPSRRKSGVSSSFLPEKTNRHRITREKMNLREKML